MREATADQMRSDVRIDCRGRCAGDSDRREMLVVRRHLTLQLLGGFCLTRRGERVAVSQPAERLLAFLGLHEAFLARIYVSGHLWGEITDERASGRLRTALWQLRSVDPVLVISDRSRIGLGPMVRVDVREMEHQARALLDRGDVCDYDLSLFKNDLLPDWYDDWILIEQLQQQQLRLEVLDQIASDGLRRGEHGIAVRAALAATKVDPLRESSHRLAVRAHLALGNRAAAIRQFDQYADLLYLEFGVTPSPAMVALIEGLRPDLGLGRNRHPS